METTKNELTPRQKKFLDGLSDYLETKLYYYGSIQRSDYVTGKSDIDVDIFTENEESTIAKLQHYLHVHKKEIKKILWKVRKHNKLTQGYKIKYKNDFLNAEFSIYNDKYKEYILYEHKNKFNLPFVYAYLLNILKIIYYQLGIIPTPYYVYLKRKILNLSVGYTSDELFVVI